ncbi:MAG: alpha/beta hydrolase [Oscillospiraceae bacterium]|jgi:pimeloyl-ACP methyl ester carboxylesterase|nr:alpha/beta hydrolase [Oscillospiraceae bacterium]
MYQKHLFIESIPAILWGHPTHALWIAVHGDQSNKADPVIALLAEEAVARGDAVLSFDLPAHGARIGGARACTPQNCIEDLQTIYSYGSNLSDTINLFGCSIGAYFAMLAYRDFPINRALFLSPILDMQRLIEDMMAAFAITPERLRREKTIETPLKTLDWAYYQYVLTHPIQWNKPTAFLRGSEDTLCPAETARAFAEHHRAHMTIMPGGEHWFHTKAQLDFYRRWLDKEFL